MRQKLQKIGQIFLLCLVLLFMGCGETTQPDVRVSQQSEVVEETSNDKEETDTEKESVQKKKQKKKKNETGELLQVDFIDVGQGDATLIRCGADAMMIDFGNNNKGTTVQKYLQDTDVTQLTYAVGTHPDADHIGGMDVILYKFPTQHVWMPNLASDTETYRDVLDVCQERGYTIEQPVWQQEYPLGSATVKIMGPVNGETDFSDKNEASIVVKVTYGTTSFLFCGDASQESENAMLSAGEDLSADVLKLGHHGSSTATGDAFLSAVHPSSAIVSCGDGNSYGHPHFETMQKLQQQKIALYRTDQQGSIQAVSDGTTITFTQTASTDYSPGSESIYATQEEPKEEVVQEEVQPEEDTQITYVLNTNTMKFHRPDCSSVEDMSEQNRADSTESRETLISQGYEPCKRCNP